MRCLAWLACAALLPAAAQIAAPANWRAQSFPFPLQFAPSIPYEGTEYVRFGPSWTHFAEEDGFTYVLLWDLKRKPLDPAELERAMNVYFDGLMELATRTRKLEDPGTVSHVSLHPMSAPEGWSIAWGGRLWTWNAFSKGEALTVNLEVTQRACTAERTQLFFAISKAPRDKPAWTELRKIRGATGCDAPAEAQAAKPG
jgi:hypothetical protein